MEDQLREGTGSYFTIDEMRAAGAKYAESLKPAVEAGILLLEAGLVFHILHLNAKNHAEHLVLDNLYNDVIQFGDEILEQVKGIYPAALTNQREAQSSNATDAFAELTRLMDHLGSCEAAVTDDALKNKLQDYLGALRRHSYLLSLAVNAS